MADTFQHYEEDLEELTRELMRVSEQSARKEELIKEKCKDIAKLKEELNAAKREVEHLKVESKKWSPLCTGLRVKHSGIFHVHVRGGNNRDCAVKIKGPDGEPEQSEIRRVGQDFYEVVYFPQTEGIYTIDLRFHDVHLSRSTLKALEREEAQVLERAHINTDNEKSPPPKKLRLDETRPTGKEDHALDEADENDFEEATEGYFLENTANLEEAGEKAGPSNTGKETAPNTLTAPTNREEGGLGGEGEWGEKE